MTQPYITNSLSDEHTVELIHTGSVGVLPTDTVYGLVCSAHDEQAVRRLYNLKHREKKPGTVIASSIEQLAELGIKKRYLSAVKQYWPNPISIEIPHSITYLHQGTGRQAFRIPDDAELRAFIDKTGPLQTTSANTPGEQPAIDLSSAQNYFDDSVDFYVDGGNLKDRLPSTIIRIVDDAIEVVRQGAVTIDEYGRMK